METATRRSKLIHTHRTLPFAPEKIYWAFSDADKLARWWGPEGFRNTFEEFDFQVGGQWKFVMHAPDGQSYLNQCVFRDLQPGKCVIIEHLSAPRFTLSVSLSLIENGTQIQWMQEFETCEAAEALRPVVEPSNEQNLDRLQILLSD